MIKVKCLLNLKHKYRLKWNFKNNSSPSQVPIAMQRLKYDIW